MSNLAANVMTSCARSANTSRPGTPKGLTLYEYLPAPTRAASTSRLWPVSEATCVVTSYVAYSVRSVTLVENPGSSTASPTLAPFSSNS